MKKVHSCLALSLLAVGFASAGPINIGTFSVGPKSTFLEQTSQDNCSWAAAGPGCTAAMFAPTILDLSALGVNPGDVLQLTVSGNICYGIICFGPLVDALFSTTNTLLSSNNPSRVPGALGPPASSGSPGLLTEASNMYFGGSNDIAGDFILNGGSVVVPTGAQFLFLGIFDSFYADNSGNASVTIIDNGDPVSANPEPGTWVLMASGIGVLTAARKRFTRN